MFKEYNQSQNYLIPPTIELFLWEKHQAIILNEIIEKIDISSLYNTYNNSEWWTSAYHPKMLLKVLVYAYINWIFSSRKIANELRHNLAFMYLAWNNQPDFRTINRFRWERLQSVERIFVEIVKIAKEMGLIKLWTISIDWTKLYSDASKYNNHTIDSIEWKIKKLFEEAQKIDEIENKKYWDKEDDIPEELKTKEWRAKKLEEIKVKIANEESLKTEIQKEIDNKKTNWINQEKINTTDKDSRLMQMKRKDYANGYNAQIATENQIVVATTISNNACDVNELIPTIEKIKKQYDTNPEKIYADKWYSSTNNYKYLESEWIDWYIPPHQELQIDMNKYVYNTEKDEYIENDWTVYIFEKYTEKKVKWKQWRLKKWIVQNPEDYWAKKYVLKTKIEGKQKSLQINKDWSRLHKVMKEKIAKEDKNAMKKRGCDVEPVFGNIKRNKRFERFSLRWFKKVNIERNIVCIAHNLTKLIWFMTI